MSALNFNSQGPPFFSTDDNYGKSFDPLDAISDGDFFANLSAFNPQKTPKVNQVDDIERITTQVLAALQSVADRRKRDDIQEAMTIREDNETEIEDRSLQKHAFQKDTNFNKSTSSLHHVPTLNMLYKVYVIIKNIFLGREVLGCHDDSRTPNEMKKGLFIHFTSWKQLLTPHYQEPFNGNITNAFLQADKLLVERQNYLKISFYQRISLYALLIIAIVGKLKNKKIITAFGLLLASVNVVGIVTYYAVSFFNQTQQGTALKDAIEKAEKEAAKNRIIHATP